MLVSKIHVCGPHPSALLLTTQVSGLDLGADVNPEEQGTLSGLFWIHTSKTEGVRSKGRVE